MVDLLQIAFEAKVAGDRGSRVAKLAVHRGELAVIWMPHVDSHLDQPGTTLRESGLTCMKPTVARPSGAWRIASA